MWEANIKIRLVVLAVMVVVAVGTIVLSRRGGSDVRIINGGILDKAATCKAFYKEVGTPQGDNETALAFHVLAQETQDLQLRAAIERVSDSFARHDPDPSAIEVNAICAP